MRTSSILPLRPESPEVFESFVQTIEVIESALATGVTPGLVAGVWSARRPDRWWGKAAGYTALPDTGAERAAVKLDTPYDIASVTKVMATTAAVARLVDRGWLDWSTPIHAVLADFPVPQSGVGVEVRHLLAHTSGLSAWEPFWKTLQSRHDLNRMTISERCTAMRSLVFSHVQAQMSQPGFTVGERAVYSDLGFMILGWVVEAITRSRLDDAVSSLVLEPLALEQTEYRPVINRFGDARGRMEVSEGSGSEGDQIIAATETCPWRQMTLQGQVHDDNCFVMGGISGHAGLFSTAENLLRFARAHFDGFLTPESLAQIWTPVSSPPGTSRTLGWDTPSGEMPSVGRGFSPHSVGHLGFTGTSLWIDPERGVAVTLLTNRVHPTRENGTLEKIKALRPQFHEAIFADLQRHKFI